MFDDRLTTIVYFADSLKTRYPDVFYPSKLNLEANGIIVKTITGTENIWLRDYMPLQVSGDFIKFRYDKQFKKYPQLKADYKADAFLQPAYESSLILDGGSIIRVTGKAVITDKVIKDNKRQGFKESKTLSEIERLLNCEIIVIPIEPGDTLGHSDGICKFIDERNILINDYSNIFNKDKRFIQYDRKLRTIFKNHSLNVETLPFGYGEWDWKMTEKYFRKMYPKADEFNPGFGYYINFLLIKGLILAPVMNIPKDVEVINTLKRFYPHCNVVAIDCSKLSMEGGLLNCVTVNYMDDNILKWLQGKPIQ